jgi:guanylate kinase
MKEIKELKSFLEKNKEKKIIILGTSCTGKSTLVKKIQNSQDMDELLFSLLTKKESEYVCNSPWTTKIGNTMTQLVLNKLKVKKGKPLFGTVIIDCDLIIYLKISDKLLKERAKKRNANYKDIKNMQKHIRTEIKKSNIYSVTYKIKDKKI